jgi:hypothetical protein
VSDLEPLGALRPPYDPVVPSCSLAVALGGGERKQGLLSVSC